MRRAETHSPVCNGDEDKECANIAISQPLADHERKQKCTVLRRHTVITKVLALYTCLFRYLVFIYLYKVRPKIPETGEQGRNFSKTLGESDRDTRYIRKENTGDFENYGGMSLTDGFRRISRSAWAWSTVSDVDSAS